jgi:hypothetical protein
MFKTLAITATIGLTALIAGCNQPATSTAPALGAADSPACCAGKTACTAEQKAACASKKAACASKKAADGQSGCPMAAAKAAKANGQAPCCASKK